VEEMYFVEGADEKEFGGEASFESISEYPGCGEERSLKVI
jgi:hypothetical protein